MSDTGRVTGAYIGYGIYSTLSMRVFVFADTFFLQVTIKLFSGLQFCVLKFVSTVHIIVAVFAFLEDEITVWEM